MIIYGLHCSHHDLCSMFGCDQRGHIDFPCNQQDTCSFCGADAPCPMDQDVMAEDCPECHV